MKFFTRYYFLAFLLSISILLETLAYTYMQQEGGRWYYSSSVIYFLAGLAICILPLLYNDRQQGAKAPFVSKYLPGAFFLFLGLLLIYHLLILIPLYNRWPRYWGGDMLPTIKLACERLLNGKRIYGPAPEIFAHSIIPYLPTMWLPFVPAVLFDFDMRHTTLIVLFLSLSLIIFLNFKNRIKIPLLPALIGATALFLLLNYFLIKDYGFWAMVEEPVVAGFYVLLAFALLRNNYWLIGLGITCCILSRYSLLLWVPVYFGYVYLTKPKTDFWKLFISFSVSITLLFVIPFFIWDPVYFIKIPSTYEDGSMFWVRNNVEEHAYHTVGLYKFFHSTQVGLMFKLELITSFLAPLLLFITVRRLQKKTSINEGYLGYGSLKISLLFFYGFVQAPYTYLSFVPTLMSFAVLFKFLSDSPEEDPAPPAPTKYFTPVRGAVFTILLTTVLLVVYYSHQITEANHLNYGQWGDGYKNYFTVAYYLKHDFGAHFTGMNYPYGENVIFCDNQPIISWILKPVSLVFPAITNYLHAIIAWLLLLSVVVAAYFIYKTLLLFEVTELHAAIFSSLIALLSPQLPRFMGHFALGYSCFLPLLIYLLVKYFKTGGSRSVFIYLTVVLTFFSFIHVYYLGMGGMFIVLLALVFAISNARQIRKYFRFIGGLVLSSVIPFVVLKAYLFLTDPVTDRPHSPWGFVDSRSSVEDILLHPNSFTGQAIRQWFLSSTLGS